jgi:PAT family beta-lactamase induction signal transducer AmpG
VRAVEVVRSRRVLVIALLGFGSGLPLLLTGQTLTAWMTAEGVSLK